MATFKVWGKASGASEISADKMDITINGDLWFTIGGQCVYAIALGMWSRAAMFERTKDGKFPTEEQLIDQLADMWEKAQPVPTVPTPPVVVPPVEPQPPFGALPELFQFSLTHPVLE